MISNWSSGRAGVFGVAVLVSGHFEEVSHELIMATRTLGRRIDQWFQGGTLTGQRLPLLPRVTIFNPALAELATLTALAQLLVSREDVRARLDDRNRVTRLASDLASGCLKWPSHREGLRRDTTDIIIAIRQAGLVHRYGRPLSAGELLPLDEAVAATRRLLELNRYRQGRHVLDESIASLVRAVYLDVKPWPFEALL
jgi:hypothetical protein